MIIAVETIDHPIAGRFMDAIAASLPGCRRWSTKEDDGAVDPSIMDGCGLCVAWHDRLHRPSLDFLPCPCVHAFCGASASKFMLATGGPHAMAKWSIGPSLPIAKRRDCVRVGGRTGCIVVVQEDHSHSRFFRFSPWFRSTVDLVRFIGGSVAVELNVMQPSVITDDVMLSSMAVAAVNHPVCLRAIDLGVPVLSFGHSLYRHDGVVVPMDNSPESALTLVGMDKARVDKGRMAAFSALTRSHCFDGHVPKGVIHAMSRATIAGLRGGRRP